MIKTYNTYVSVEFDRRLGGCIFSLENERKINSKIDTLAGVKSYNDATLNSELSISDCGPCGVLGDD